MFALHGSSSVARGCKRSHTSRGMRTRHFTKHCHFCWVSAPAIFIAAACLQLECIVHMLPTYLGTWVPSVEVGTFFLAPYYKSPPCPQWQGWAQRLPGHMVRAPRRFARASET